MCEDLAANLYLIQTSDLLMVKGWRLKVENGASGSNQD